MWIDPDELLSDWEPSGSGGRRRDGQRRAATGGAAGEESPEDLQMAFRLLLEMGRRKLPQEDFAKHALWDEILISLSVSLGAKQQMLAELAGGQLAGEKACELYRELVALRECWQSEVGEVTAYAIHCRAGLYLIDSRREEDLLGLRRGDPDEDAALLLCCARLDSATPEARGRRLHEAAALGPRSAALWETLAATRLDQAVHLREAPPEILRDAARWAEEALRREPSRPLALHVSGRALASLAIQEGGEEKRLRLETACRQLAESAHLAPGAAVFHDWGYALGETAVAQEDEARRVELLREACRCYDEALRLDPDDLRSKGGMISMRWALADAVEDVDEKSRALSEVRAVLQEMLRQVPAGERAVDLHWVLGCVLTEQARLEPDPDARRPLLHQACSELERLGGLGPEPAEACVRWGRALLGLAALSTSKARQRSLERAGEVFAQGVRVTGGDGELLCRIASSWLQFVPSAAGKEAQEAARRAAEAARQANRLEPGAGDYELACALSRLGEMAEAAAAVTAALARNPEDTRHALDDPDLQPLWEARPDLRRALAAG